VRHPLREEAGRDAEQLKEIHAVNYVMARVYYLEHIGDTEAALAELERASRRAETSDLVAQYALALYERGQDAEALRVLEERLKSNNSAGQMLRILLLAEQPEGGYDKAYERYRELVRQRRLARWMAPRKGEAQGPTWSPFQLDLVLVLGKSKEAADLNESISGDLPIAKYLSGSLSEAEFLESVGKNRVLLCGRHYLIGLVRLSNGDRAGAREHFQKTLDTKFYTHNLYRYARAYLARLKRDPEWPKWIPVKK
jgi:tetratricopeptide (TPR) repeat protein